MHKETFDTAALTCCVSHHVARYSHADGWGRDRTVGVGRARDWRRARWLRRSSCPARIAVDELTQAGASGATPALAAGPVEPLGLGVLIEGARGRLLVSDEQSVAERVGYRLHAGHFELPPAYFPDSSMRCIGNRVPPSTCIVAEATSLSSQGSFAA